MSFVFFSTVVTLSSVRSDCQEGEGKGGREKIIGFVLQAMGALQDCTGQL